MRSPIRRTWCRGFRKLQLPRIQRLLTDPAYEFREELSDLKEEIKYRSENGKTVGALSPNEFWYFWRRFVPGDEFSPREVLEKSIDGETLCAEIAGVIDVFCKPWAAKGMIFNENIPLIAELVPNVRVDSPAPGIQHPVNSRSQGKTVRRYEPMVFIQDSAIPGFS